MSKDEPVPDTALQSSQRNSLNSFSSSDTHNGVDYDTQRSSVALEKQKPSDQAVVSTPHKLDAAPEPTSIAAEPDVETPIPQRPAFDDEAEKNYKPKTFKFWSIIFSIFISMFLVGLDRTIISTAIPQITNDFHSLGDIGWYGSAYMLTTSAFQLLFGRIYRFYDLRWTLLTCIILFEVGSAICGAAPNSTAFIFGRAIAGAGSAGIFTGSMMTILPLVPLHKRPMFQGRCLIQQSIHSNSLIIRHVRNGLWHLSSHWPIDRRRSHWKVKLAMVFLHESPCWRRCSCLPLLLPRIAKERRGRTDPRHQAHYTT